MIIWMNAILGGGYDNLKGYISDLNEIQSYFRFDLVDKISMSSDREEISLKELYGLSGKVKKIVDCDFLVTITDKKIIVPNSEEDCKSYLGITPGFSVVHWTVTYNKYELYKDIMHIAAQYATRTYLECNQDYCLFSKKSNQSLKLICDECKLKLSRSGISEADLEGIQKSVYTICKRYQKDSTNNRKSRDLLSGIEDDSYISDISAVIIMDIVGYSLLTDTEQKKRILLLQEIIRENKLMQKFFRDLIFLPTGDGCVISMFGKISRQAVKLAISLQQDIKSNGLLVRFGINFGSVFKYEDINGNLNVAGSGVNMAARAMDEGDENHIIANRTVYDYFGNVDKWYKQLFTSLGKVTIKHGEELELFNIYNEKEQIGNPALPLKLRRE